MSNATYKAITKKGLVYNFIFYVQKWVQENLETVHKSYELDNIHKRFNLCFDTYNKKKNDIIDSKIMTNITSQKISLMFSSHT